jgi:hypothetical protein
MSLSLLHVGHSLLQGLQHLSLRYQHLLKCWRRVGSIVVIAFIHGTFASVCHLMNVKRFETEIGIKDSQPYTSRYSDD